VACINSRQGYRKKLPLICHWGVGQSLPIRERWAELRIPGHRSWLTSHVRGHNGGLDGSPRVVACTCAYCTLGEMMDALREPRGVYTELLAVQVLGGLRWRRR